MNYFEQELEEEFAEGQDLERMKEFITENVKKEINSKCPECASELGIEEEELEEEAPEEELEEEAPEEEELEEGEN